ncbi:MAG TPA: serine/threonine-protein kinase, partial [Burkholderiaceae bacterium]|nr:serine/threonine-protein kinase [Burkholderiaceae bacterium]
MPQRIGRYAVRARLGEGATSEVFLARDDFHDRMVAIKRVRRATLANAQDAHYSSRFFAAEAALVGRLMHPNVVQLYDAVDDPHEPYLVLEYVPGGTLREHCRPDALLALEQIVEVGFKCAMALGYVYRQGLIHRDVKPANLLATVERGRVLDVKISDFGSALNLEATRTQVFRVGSLTYMSPEQLDGSDLDARADQYSLAAVLYHLIAGRPPFEAPAQAALMHQICHAEPAPLSGLRDGVPAALDAIVRKALSKSCDDRYADWDAFAQALSSLVARRELPSGALREVLDSERFN